MHRGERRQPLPSFEKYSMIEKMSIEGGNDMNTIKIINDVIIMVLDIVIIVLLLKGRKERRDAE